MHGDEYFGFVYFWERGIIYYVTSLSWLVAILILRIFAFHTLIKMSIAFENVKYINAVPHSNNPTTEADNLHLYCYCIFYTVYVCDHQGQKILA